jgi:uncharacterized membrane protein YbhN (UPF0104 family)
MPIMKRHLKTILSLCIIAATIAAFSYYVSHHPETVDHLRNMPPGTLMLLLLCYGVWFLALVLVTRISLKMYGKSMGRQENFLFNAYSSLINFFGPGQSGPIFRGAYLKKRHNLGIKQYVFATLMYYGFYAVINAMFMFVGSRPWWQTAFVMIAAGGGSLVLIKWYAKKKAHIGNEPGINARTVSMLFGATALQMVAQVAIYAIELHNTGANASFGQVLSYTGVANFALFVALTPGAIGIREAFLVFSQNLHHISSTAIVAANIIDRAVYLVFLGLLFVLVLGMHAKDKLELATLEVEKS